MQKNLVIVESPAKAKTIEKFLGNDYKVLSSYGHIRDLKKKEFSIDVANGYAPAYEIPEDKKKLVKELKAEAKKAEAEAMKEKQDYYQQMAADLAKDRDYYKQDRDEHRNRLDDMDRKMRELQAQVARNGRKVDAMVPFMCGDLACKLRRRVVISDDGEIEDRRSKS